MGNRARPAATKPSASRSGPDPRQGARRAGRPVRDASRRRGTGGFAHRGTECAQRVAGRRAVRYDITHDPAKIAGIWTPPGNRTRSPRRPRSNSCAPARCWVSISTPITWPAACWTPRAIRSGPGDDPSRHRPVCPHPGATGGSARRSPRCSMPLPRRVHGGGDREPRLQPMPAPPPRHDGPRHAWKRFRRTVAAIPTARFPTDSRHGDPPRDRDHRGGCGLHQPMGRPTLGQTLAAADFRPVTGHHGAATRRSADVASD